MNTEEILNLYAKHKDAPWLSDNDRCGLEMEIKDPYDAHVFCYYMLGLLLDWLANRDTQTWRAKMSDGSPTGTWYWYGPSEPEIHRMMLPTIHHAAIAAYEALKEGQS